MIDSHAEKQRVKLQWFDSRFDTSFADVTSGLYLPAPGETDLYLDIDDSYELSSGRSYYEKSTWPMPKLVQFQSLPPWDGATLAATSYTSSSSELHGVSQKFLEESAILLEGMKINDDDDHHAIISTDSGFHRKSLRLTNLHSDVQADDIKVLLESCAVDGDFTVENNAIHFPTVDSAQRAFNALSAQPTLFGDDAVHVQWVGENENFEEPTKNKTLLVTLSTLVYPVSVELLTDLFSLHGTVEKIVTFSKTPNTFQALIQMAYVDEAVAAYEALNNRNMYDNCNHMKIQYSRLTELSVQQNNSQAWDYTKARNMASLSPGYADILGMSRMPREIKEWKNNAPSINGNVLIAYHLSPDVTIEDLFNIFSLCGVVMRVKFLREKPDTALIQFADPVYTSLAKYFLNNMLLWEQPVQLAFSKVPEVKLPASCAGNDDRNRAFSPGDQRFAEPEKFGRSVCFPTNTIFIANIRNETPHKLVIEMVCAPCDVVAYEMRLPYVHGPKKTHMLVQYATTYHALRGIARLHNQVVDRSQLKVAFSKVNLDSARAVFLINRHNRSV